MSACLLLGLVVGFSEPPDFEKRIAPLLIRNCLGCHTDLEPSGELSLQNAAGMEKVVVRGKPADSTLFQRIESGEMPPKDKGKSKELSPAEKELVKAWIESGAPWPKGRILGIYEKTTDARGGLDWWSLQPIRKPAIPAKSGETNPIDAFLAVQWADKGVAPAPLASKRTLLRRVYLDLIGLTPTSEELDRFEADPSPTAYETVVDRLLADPRHGERWARYWLDLVRYADTNGYERDAEKPFAWKYRDYVIQSINKDKPYDRFVLQQMAGDELPNRTEEDLIATGMLRVGTWDDEPNDKLEYTYDRLEDLVQVTSTAFLGMSIKCARCHDHKFDPIPQVDYHRFAAAFWPGDLVGNSVAKIDGHDVLAWTDLNRPLKPFHLLKKGDPHRPQQQVGPGFVSMVGTLNQPFEPAPPQSKTTTRRLQLAKRMIDPANPLTPRVAVNRIWQQHFGHGIVRTSDNMGFKGDPPTHPELLDWLAGDFVANGWKAKRLHKLIVTSRAYRQSSVNPQEAAFAKTDAANRYYWKWERHRLDAEALRDNLLAAGEGLDSRMGGPGFSPPLSVEAAEGLSKKNGAWKSSPESELRRRSIYMLHRRSLISPFLSTFDFCDTTRPCAQRDITLVAPQALALLNDEFVHKQSQAMARKLLLSPSKEGVSDSSKVELVRAAWRKALGRYPSPSEQDAALEHLRQLAGDRPDSKAFLPALASLCHVLLNTNEFAYAE